MRIKVTKKDIINGERGSCDNCPVARATSRVFNTADIAVDADDIEIKNNMYQTPTVAAEFIFNFDDGAPVEPFEFELGEQL